MCWWEVVPLYQKHIRNLRSPEVKHAHVHKLTENTVQSKKQNKIRNQKCRHQNYEPPPSPNPLKSKMSPDINFRWFQAAGERLHTHSWRGGTSLSQKHTRIRTHTHIYANTYCTNIHQIHKTISEFVVNLGLENSKYIVLFVQTLIQKSSLNSLWTAQTLRCFCCRTWVT